MFSLSNPNPLQADSANFGDVMKACDKRDCKRRYFFNEALRWVKQALADVGQYNTILDGQSAYQHISH